MPNKLEQILIMVGSSIVLKYHNWYCDIVNKKRLYNDVSFFAAMPSSGLGVDVLFIRVHGFCVGISVDGHVQRDQDVNRRGLCGSTQGF